MSEHTVFPGSSDKEEAYISLWRWLCTNRENVDQQRKEDEEFYFSDVEGTRSQFTEEQLQKIKEKYNVPISTKLTYPIMEQILSYITGGKPTSRLLAPEEASAEWTKFMGRLLHAVWQESWSDVELTHALRDMLAVGSGFLVVRKNDFYRETTWGATVEYEPWGNVYVDPTSRRQDFADADVICISRPMTIAKIEQKFDIKVKPDDIDHTILDSAPYEIDTLAEGWTEWNEMGGQTQGTDLHKKSRYAYVKEFYQKKNKKAYISPEGYCSLEKPTETQIPNEEKLALLQQVQQMQQQLMEKREGLAQAKAGLAEADGMASSGDRAEMSKAHMGQSQAESELDSAEEQMNEMMAQAQAMPDMVPAYSFILSSGEEVFVEEFKKVEKPFIERVLMVDRTIKETEILPTDMYPIIHLCIAHNRHPNKTYGMIHFIKDFVKALNKMWGMLIYDMQLIGHPKVLVASGTITDLTDFERNISFPGSVSEYDVNPDAKDGGMPQIIGGQPVDATMERIISLLVHLTEYVSGMFGIMQGGQGAQQQGIQGLGQLQSMQNVGSQRIKLYGRYLEPAFSQLSYVLVGFLQKYCPREQIALYLDEDQDGSEIEMMRQATDLRFKVRTEVAQNLPTSRQMASTMLSTIAQSVQDPGVQELFMNYSLKFMDMKEADDMLEQIDVIKKFQQQLQQAQSTIQDLEGQLKAAQNNLAQKDIESESLRAKEQIKSEKEKEIIKNQAEVGQSTPVEFDEEGGF